MYSRADKMEKHAPSASALAESANKYANMDDASTPLALEIGEADEQIGESRVGTFKKKAWGFRKVIWTGGAVIVGSIIAAFVFEFSFAAKSHDPHSVTQLQHVEPGITDGSTLLLKSNLSALYLHVSSGSIKNGDPVFHTGSTTSGSEWKVEHVGGMDTMIMLKSLRSGFYLHVASEKQSSGDQVFQKNSASDGSKWQVEYIPPYGSMIRLKSVRSGFYLQATPKSERACCDPVFHTDSETDGSKWIMEVPSTDFESATSDAPSKDFESATLSPRRRRGTSGCASESESKSCYLDKTCRRIIIMRHGERGPHGIDPLNSCGWERAYRYVDKMGKGSVYNVQAIYAFNYVYSSDQTSAQRCAQTASYLSHPSPVSSPSPGATDHHVYWGTCSSDCGKLTQGRSDCQNKKMAATLKQHMIELGEEEVDANYTQSFPAQSFPAILVFWEHTNIIHLLHKLSPTTYDHLPDADNWCGRRRRAAQTWCENDFDSYVEVYYRQNEQHHCGTKVSKWGIQPKGETGGDSWKTCKYCDDSKEPWCTKRTPAMISRRRVEGQDIAVCRRRRRN